MIVIVDYGVGNLRSIQNMLHKTGSQSVISGDAAMVADASKLLLPGMGAFDNCMTKLDKSGLMPVLEQKILKEKVPVLGICVGFQMFMQSSEEGMCKGLGWVDGQVVKFQSERLTAGQKVPNMGWLDVHVARDSRLVEGLPDARFYFAQSYHVVISHDQDMLFQARYGYDFCAGIEHDNIIGVQFHPEKSHRFGMKLLKNFAEKY